MSTMDFRAAVLATLGRAPEVIEPGRFHRFATSDRRGDSSGYCKLYEDMRGGTFGCHRQGIRENWTCTSRSSENSAQRSSLISIRATLDERAKNNAVRRLAHERRNAGLLAHCATATFGDPLWKYLRRRGLGAAWPLPVAIALHPALDYWQEGRSLGKFPAMVAAMQAPDGRVVALHRTYLTDEGRKANVPVVKKLTGVAGTVTGACIRLRSPAFGVLGVAEGIETALAASLASGVPTVAAYCASALATFVWPAGVQRLVIFADADKAGREAAATLRVRALAGRLRCEVQAPTTEGKDWCDVFAERGAELVEAGSAP